MGSRVPAVLRKQLGDEATFGLIEMFDDEQAEWREDVLMVATDRFERRLAEEMAAMRLDFRTELHEGLTSVRREIADTRSDLLKWSFVFWVGQLAAMAALAAFVLRVR